MMMMMMKMKKKKMMILMRKTKRIMIKKKTKKKKTMMRGSRQTGVGHVPEVDADHVWHDRALKLAQERRRRPGEGYLPGLCRSTEYPHAH
jgi:hypothetical protein